MGKAISSQADGLKRCTKCGLEKPLSEYRSRPGRGIYRPQCRSCERDTIKSYNRGYYRRNGDKVREAVAKYRAEHLDEYKAYERVRAPIRHRERKREALAVIGEQCACCGESQFEFLTIDHVDNDGHIHRHEASGRNFYELLRMVNYKTEYRLQTLCFNCNFAKRYNGGVCPHQNV